MKIDAKFQNKRDYYKKIKEAFINEKIFNFKLSSSDIISLKIGEQKVIIIDAIIDDKKENGFYNHQTRHSHDNLIFFDRNFSSFIEFLSKEDQIELKKIIKIGKKNLALLKIINAFQKNKNKTLSQKNKIMNYYRHMD